MTEKPIAYDAGAPAPPDGCSRLVLTRRLDEKVIIRDTHGNHIATIELIAVRGNSARLSFVARQEYRVDREEYIRNPPKDKTMRQLYIVDHEDKHLGTFDYDRGVYAMGPGANVKTAAQVLADALGYVEGSTRSFSVLALRRSVEGTFEEVSLAELGLSGRPHIPRNRPAVEEPVDPTPDNGLRGAISTPDPIPGLGGRRK